MINELLIEVSKIDLIDHNGPKDQALRNRIVNNLDPIPRDTAEYCIGTKVDNRY